ncbi:DsbA family protein [Acidovorax sp. SUPP2539]|uniref:DsbA family protein n=1 Tax=Acidovorax sp. SUPP2539 TaxID=2920878 RepID=UPI0023DE468B|nr:DsbA family protein [Acidovorax sp. SUPP2539]GKS87855.1 DsbA family protein [Acidovorax sp. SUPP2539]
MAAVNAAAPSAVLHYVFDPLCGWCYAAAPLVQAARQVPGLAIALHGGGMLAGPNRIAITPRWRDHVVPHDRRIAQLTGQPFGEAYFEGLLRDPTAVMDSEPPTTAILAAQALGQRGLDIAHRIQQAHYAQGRRVADAAVLQDLAAELGLDAEAFRAAFAQWQGAPTQAHFAESRQWLARAGGQGFPTLALEQPGAPLQTLDIGPWLGQPEAWKTVLRQHLEAGRAAIAPAGSALACGPDGCAI